MGTILFTIFIPLMKKEMKELISLFIFASILGLGCKSSEPYVKPDESIELTLDKRNQTTLSLAQQISKLPGVTLYAGAPVFQRVLNDESKSIFEKRPLYVINGYRVGNVFADVNAAIISTDVKEINGIIGAEAAPYGPLAINGVIEITTY